MNFSPTNRRVDTVMCPSTQRLFTSPKEVQTPNTAKIYPKKDRIS